MNHNQLIIDNSKSLSKCYRFVQALVTLCLWGAIGYLALPLASPLTELFNLDIVYHKKIDTALFISLVLTMGLVCAYIYASMLVWRLYNIALYHYKKRTQWPTTHIVISDLASYFGVSTTDLGLWQNSRELNIKLCENGHIESVRSRSWL